MKYNVYDYGSNPLTFWKSEQNFYYQIKVWCITNMVIVYFNYHNYIKDVFVSAGKTLKPNYTKIFAFLLITL